MEKVSKIVLIKVIETYWKRICLLAIISIFIGGVIGYIYAAQGIEEAIYYAEEIEMFVYEEREGMNYYNQYIEELKIHYEKITKYINGLNSLFEKDIEEIKELIDSGKEWENTELKFAEEYNVLKFPILPECIDRKKQNLEYNLYDMEMQKIEMEKNYNLIQAMGDVVSQDEAIIKTYENILNSAGNYGMVSRRIEVYKRQLGILNSQSQQEIEETARNMDEYLGQATQRLNTLVGQVNQLAGRIAKENHVVIDAGIGVDPKDPNVFGVYVYHIGQNDSMESIICAFAVFFLLFGGCIGLLFAVYKVCKDEKGSVNE